MWSSIEKKAQTWCFNFDLGPYCRPLCTTSMKERSSSWSSLEGKTSRTFCLPWQKRRWRKERKKKKKSGNQPHSTSLHGATCFLLHTKLVCLDLVSLLFQQMLSNSWECGACNGWSVPSVSSSNNLAAMMMDSWDSREVQLTSMSSFIQRFSRPLSVSKTFIGWNSLRYLAFQWKRQ